jgi:hypothetical protein
MPSAADVLGARYFGPVEASCVRIHSVEAKEEIARFLK